MGRAPGLLVGVRGKEGGWAPPGITLPRGDGEPEQALAPLRTERPDAQYPGLVPPASQPLVDGINNEVGDCFAAQSAGAKGCVRLAPGVGQFPDLLWKRTNGPRA